ncbi:FAD-dependent oxidoreductase [Peribacillus saganii]|nr:FAD-dependent oxidoreductase [Peribacillus saganii]
MRIHNSYQYDVIVVGGGQAALAAAISAKEEGSAVALITKGKAGLGGSSVISDGVHSTIFSPGDSPEIFCQDMIAGGKGLSDRRLAEILAEECTNRVNELESKYGIPQQLERKVSTPGHSFPRRSYAPGGVGRNVTRPMREYAQSAGIDFFEQSSIVDLIKGDTGIVGAFVQNEEGMQAFYAGSVILATGGFGGLYASSDNPRDVSGEAIGMAWRHGAVLRDMEFIQFYPYRLQHPANLDVMTRIFGKGAILLNQNNERFMESFPRKELETRDIISYEMFKQHKVLLDFSSVAGADLEHDSPLLYRTLKKGYQGEYIMSPVQHYCMGGIKTDEYGRTNLPGLYACGECSGGLHGANRLGGGSLTEALVFGKRTGYMATKESKDRIGIAAEQEFAVEADEAAASDFNEQEVIKAIKTIMWTKAGIERTSQSLLEAANELDTLADQLEKEKGIAALQLHDKVRAAWAAAHSASVRKESRGAHKLLDFREQSSDWELTISVLGKELFFTKQGETIKGVDASANHSV